MSFFDDVEAGFGPSHRWGPGSLRTFCLEICSLCLMADPDMVLDLGTGAGWSGISLAYALKLLDKPLSVMTTIAWNMKGWEVMLDSELPRRHDLALENIQAVPGNFLDRDPERFVKSGRMMIFYDMHDFPPNDWFLSERFLSKWVPLIDLGLVGVHDIGMTSPAYKLGSRSNGYPQSRATHWAGRHFAGFGETAVFIEWLNKHHGQIMLTNSSTKYFWVKKGKPL